MLIVMAIQTQQFPVAAVGRVVVVIVIAVVDGQFAQIGAVEFAGAAAAYPWVDLECLLAIALVAEFGRAAGVRDDAVEFAWRGDAHLPIFPAGDCSGAVPGSWIRPC